MIVYMRGKWMLFGGIAIFLAIGAGAIAWWRGQQPSGPAAGGAAKSSEGSQQQQGAVGDEAVLQGKLQPQEMLPVAAPIEGIIDELFVDAGGEVYEGQLVARIRNGKLDAALESATAEVEKIKTRITTLEGSIIAARLEASRADAESARLRADYDRAERAFSRQQMLLREGATPRLTFEKTEREFKQVKTDADMAAEVARSADDRVQTLTRDLDAARKLLDNKAEALENAKEEAGQGEVKSPVDGIVISRKGAPGEPITPDVEDFFVFASKLSAMQVSIDVAPDAAAVLGRLKPGQVAGVRVAELGPNEVPGFVREVKGNQVLVDFVTPEGATLKQGLTAQVRVDLRPAAPAAVAAPKPAATK